MNILRIDLLKSIKCKIVTVHNQRVNSASHKHASYQWIICSLANKFVLL